MIHQSLFTIFVTLLSVACAPACVIVGAKLLSVDVTYTKSSKDADCSSIARELRSTETKAFRDAGLELYKDGATTNIDQDADGRKLACYYQTLCIQTGNYYYCALANMGVCGRRTLRGNNVLDDDEEDTNMKSLSYTHRYLLQTQNDLISNESKAKAEKSIGSVLAGHSFSCLSEAPQVNINFDV